MKLLIPLLSFFILCVLLACAIPTATLSRWEGSLRYSMGLAGERRLPGQEREPILQGESKETAWSAQDNESSIFAEKEKSYTCSFEGDEPDLARAIAQKIPPVEGNIDFRGFAFSDRLPVLTAPLSDRELCYVFSAIARSATLSVPVKARLEYISLTKKEDLLYVEAKVLLDLSELVATRRLSWLPESAEFAVSMQFELKNPEISVCYDKITVKCNTVEIPEALLVFGCNVAFGKKDYRVLFGNAVANVLLNARIYG